MKIHDISTFQELDEYCNTLIEILNIIDQYSEHPMFLNYDFSTTYVIYKKSHGVEGYSYALLRNSAELISIGYFNLDPHDITWSRYYGESSNTHIYAFPQKGKDTFEYYDEVNNRSTDVPYNYEYNTEMYTQLEFVHPKEQVNTSLCISKLIQSDSTREYRQFVIYETDDIDFSTLLQELRQYIFDYHVHTGVLQ